MAREIFKNYYTVKGIKWPSLIQKRRMNVCKSRMPSLQRWCSSTISEELGSPVSENGFSGFYHASSWRAQLARCCFGRCFSGYTITHVSLDSPSSHPLITKPTDWFYTFRGTDLRDILRYSRPVVTMSLSLQTTNMSLSLQTTNNVYGILQNCSMAPGNPRNTTLVIF